MDNILADRVVSSEDVDAGSVFVGNYMSKDFVLVHLIYNYAAYKVLT